VLQLNTSLECPLADAVRYVGGNSDGGGRTT